ncbi:hypothetical protein MESS4_610055 [Mesorhizobium sp. STM 4661]|nr:hypothetical protein MESS4_610055 [Mesorhizobium sp. STM 4661]
MRPVSRTTQERAGDILRYMLNLYESLLKYTGCNPARLQPVPIDQRSSEEGICAFRGSCRYPRGMPT